MPRLLDWYLMRAVVGGVTIVFFVLIALIGFFTFLAELDSVGRGTYTAWKAMQYAVLYLPGVAYEIFPIVCLLGSLLGLGNLAAGSELVVMRAAGISLLRLAISVLGAGFLLGLFCFALGDFLAPSASQQAETLKTSAKYGNAARLIGSLWFRDGNKVLHVAEAESGERSGRIEVFTIDKGLLLSSAGRADAAQYEDRKWYLENWRVSVFNDEGVAVHKAKEQPLVTSLTPDLMSLFAVDPEDFSSLGLVRYIQYMEDNSLDAGSFRQALWNKALTPLTVALMTLLALPFVLGSLRSSGAGIRLMIGVMIGVGYFLAIRIFGNVGQVYDLHPAITALIPALIVLAATAVGIKRAR